MRLPVHLSCTYVSFSCFNFVHSQIYGDDRPTATSGSKTLKFLAIAALNRHQECAMHTVICYKLKAKGYQLRMQYNEARMQWKTFL